MRRYLGVLAVLTATISFAACDEKLSTLAGPTPNLEPTFASVQRDIFETTDVAGRTACTNCHSNVGRNPSGGLNLLHDLAYDQIVNVSSSQQPGIPRVKPGDPDGSYLVRKLQGTAGITGRRMPFSGPPYLTDGQILILRRWIELGAPRN
jgi:hypothetical protein